MNQQDGGILVFAEQQNGKIHKITYELLGKARELAKKLAVPVSCALLGPDGISAWELVYSGADLVYYIADDCFSVPDEILYRQNLADLIGRTRPQICLIGATSFGRSLAPGLAGACKAGLTADCTGLEIDEDGALIQIRPAFSENILVHIKSSAMPQMATVRYREFDALPRDAARRGKVVNLAAKNSVDPFIKTIKRVRTNSTDISDAKVVVAAGRGLKSAQDLGMIRELASLLGGVVGASRQIVDDGFLSKEHQVGYSGARVKPGLYVACGISGAPQHLAGMKDSGYIVAVNSDPSAPIFSVADFGIVGDLYRVVPQMITKTKAAGAPAAAAGGAMDRTG